MACDYNIRFAENNFAPESTYTFSSELSAFPFTNALDPLRSKVWRPSGQFLIDATNDQLYYNDGADQTISISQGSYTTPELLASQITTDSAGAITCTYDTAEYKFILTFAASVTLQVTNTTNSIWDTIGFLTSVDLTDSSFTSDEQRNHTSEYCVFDTGFNTYVTFVSFISLIGPLGEVFSFSPSATLTVSANNVDLWASPPLQTTFTADDFGVMGFVSDLFDDTDYRYWRLEIVDKTNPAGPNGLEISNIYVGDHITTESRNLSSGFENGIIDSSISDKSDDGTEYFDVKDQYETLNNIGLRFISKDDRLTLKSMFRKMGTRSPLYVSIDPKLDISDEITEFTKYVTFETSPTFSHVKHDIFSVSFAFKEVI